MVAPLSNFTIAEQRAVTISFFVARSH